MFPRLSVSRPYLLHYLDSVAALIHLESVAVTASLSIVQNSLMRICFLFNAVRQRRVLRDGQRRCSYYKPMGISGVQMSRTQGTVSHIMAVR